MSKRGPTSELNHDNWDDKFEPEEAGTFTRAPNDALQKRVIRTAKRRSAFDQSKNPFANFAGFKTGGGTPVSVKSDAKATFSFVSTPALKTNGISEKPKPTFANVLETKEDNKSTEKSNSDKSDRYIANLKELNRSVSDWIKMHVDKDAACILTPIFKDYEMYLEKIKNEKSDNTVVGITTVSETTKSENTGRSPLLLTSGDSKNSSDSKDKTPKTSEENNIRLQTSGENNAKPQAAGENNTKPQITGESNQTPKSSIFSSFTSDKPVQNFFSIKPDPSKLMINPFLNKLDKNDNKSTSKPEGGFKFSSSHTTGFSFSSSSSNSSSSNKPFTFGNVANTEKEKEKQEQADDQSEEPPPKNEFKPIEEEGSVYSVRCKVFIKKESEYTDLGVGTLFIKKVNGEKHQLLVRAETVTGNILINVLLSKSLPTQLMGKNNVMLICMPTPQASLTSCLLRVKTAEQADELLKTINTYKN